MFKVKNLKAVIFIVALTLLTSNTAYSIVGSYNESTINAL